MEHAPGMELLRPRSPSSSIVCLIELNFGAVVCDSSDCLKAKSIRELKSHEQLFSFLSLGSGTSTEMIADICHEGCWHDWSDVPGVNSRIT